MKVTKSVNKSDEEIGANIQELHIHMIKRHLGKCECYQQICKEVKDQMPAVLPSQAPAYCSFDDKKHISFDFAKVNFHLIHYNQDLSISKLLGNVVFLD